MAPFPSAIYPMDEEEVMLLRHFTQRLRSHHSVHEPIDMWDDERLKRESLKIQQPIRPLVASTFGGFLDIVIAARDGVRPDQVTTQYIHEQRERRFYPTIRYEIGSSYGGYCTDGLHFLTLQEFDQISTRVSAELAKL